MMPFWGKKEKYVHGLDIGSSFMKLVTLKNLKDSCELCDYKVLEVGPNLVEGLKKLVQLSGSHRVNIAVSGQGVVTRYIDFVKMDEQELKQAIQFEAQEHIPYSIADVNLDCSILKAQLPENKMLVMLVAVKKDFLERRIMLLRQAGLEVNLVDIDGLSLANSFSYGYSADVAANSKTVALLNIGSVFSNLIILEGLSPRLSRDINIAGNNFTQKIADIFDLDFKAAEQLKISPDKDKIEKVATAVGSILVNLAAEIRVSFDYFESQRATSVGKIYLSGGSGLFTGLQDMLGNVLDLEVDYWNPFERILLAPGIDPLQLKALAPQLAVATGLALRQTK